MSVVDSLGKMFRGTPTAGAEGEPSRMDLGVDSQGGAEISMLLQGESMDSVQGDPGPVSRLSEPQVAAEEALVALPFLGQASVSVHQRRLLVLLAMGVLMLVLLGGWMMQGAQRSTRQLTEVGQALMQSQRLVKSFGSTLAGLPKAEEELANSAQVLARNMQALSQGDAELGVKPLGEAFAGEIEGLQPLMERAQRYARAMPGRSKALQAARDFPGEVSEALKQARAEQEELVRDSESARQLLETIQSRLVGQSGWGTAVLVLLALLALFVLLCGAGIAYVEVLSGRHRQARAEALQRESRQREQEARRVNDANQAAILRLMNELQSVAEGDLTQEATVTEDITGAIADSVNYTVEELRALVGSVQNTATRVAQTTAEVDGTSTELLAASTEQLREIRETGQSVLDMATRINEVSSQAQESATVARQSLQAADQGLRAVQNSIGGMNAIRDQIQDTSKRIKRLGESSQEIGEITELISDITEQTNVLALNAAIQAASAGEAGRGFSVVAEEVQRLAERSADATRQIAALVKAIQTDTQDAVAAMERSTHGVVEGARLSDSAGTALSEIDSVSRRLAELIEHISSSTLREAQLANGVAESIQHIFAVTEQTGEGTRTTAHQVRELSQMAEELRQSVSRFKIA